jgi:outer membrane protein insertion porin family
MQAGGQLWLSAAPGGKSNLRHMQRISLAGGGALYVSILKARGRASRACAGALLTAAILMDAPYPIAAQVQTSPSNTNPSKPLSAATPVAEQTLSSYAGQIISSVLLAGQPGLNPSEFTSLMMQKPGEPFSAERVEQTAAALKATGKFREVRTQVSAEAQGVQVMYVLEPAVYFGIYQFPGAEQFAYSQLIQVSNYPVQTPFSQHEVDRDAESLRHFFQQEGFFEAQVHPELNVDSEHGIANVVFHVDLDRRAKFGTVSIEGVTDDQDAKLEHRLTTLFARLRGVAIRPGRQFNRTTLTRAEHYLESRLQRQGYLGAQSTLKGANYNPDTNRADIYYTIKPGAKTQVQISGARVWSWTRRDLLPMYQGVGADPETVQEGQQALASHFQARGYFDVKVNARFEAQPGQDVVIYQIERNRKHKVTAVRISGNETLPDAKLTPSLVVQRKRLFSRGTFSNDLVRTSVNNLKAIYEAEGFSAVKVTDSVERERGNIQVSFKVSEGPRDIVNEISIEGADTFPESQFAPQGLKVKVGQPYSQARVVQDRGAIMANYLRAGYLNANFRETATKVSKQEPHRINVAYHIYEGPRVKTGTVITLGRKQTNIRIIQNNTAAIRPGKPLAASDLLSTGTRLYDLTGVFDWAEVDPKREITAQTKEDVLVKLHEAKRNEFQWSVGFEVIQRGGSVPSGTAALPNLPPIGLPANFVTNESTFYGPRGTAQYTRNNLRGKGESASVTMFAGRLDQRAALYYIDPNFRWGVWKATTSGSIERNEENPIFSAQILTASEQFQRTIDHAQKNLFFARFSYGKTDLTHVLLAQLVPPEDEHVKLSTLSANLTRDTRDNAIDAHRGMFGTIEIDFNPSALGSNVDFVKLTGQAAFYKEKIHHIVWANSIRVGMAQPFNNSFVPLSEQFFTGGGNSLRGIPLDSAGPQRTIFLCPTGTTSCDVTAPFPTGGNSLLILNSEARIPLSAIIKNLGVAVFYDGGGVFQPTLAVSSQNSFASLYSNNVGVGLRYSTPVGPIRFDIGKDLNAIPGTSPPQRYSLQYFVTIGQAF